MALDSVPEYGGYRSGMDTRSAAKTNVVSDTARVIGVNGGDIGLGGFAAAVGPCCTVFWARSPACGARPFSARLVFFGEGTSPPQRELLMHQLYLLKDGGSPRLDAELFAQKIDSFCRVGVVNMEQELGVEGRITCPHCGHVSLETMPTNACLYFFECIGCGTLLRPKAGDCCVFCSYGDVLCPPRQGDGASCC